MPEKNLKPFGVSGKLMFCYALSALGAVFLPVILWKSQLPIILSTYGAGYQVFELFAFCVSLILVLFGGIILMRKRRERFQNLILVLLPFLISFHFLILICEYSQKSLDYRCYEAAGQAVIDGRNPYRQTNYLYPPLTAQVMALGYRTIVATAKPFLEEVSTSRVWDLIFYAYQCCQYFMIQLCIYLCYRFARLNGIRPVPAMVLVCALFLFNDSLARTLKHNQVNLLVLNAVLAAVLLLRRYPIASGLAVAFGVHVKLTPMALLGPWGFARQWRLLAGAFLGFAGIVLVQTHGGRDFEFWRQYLGFSEFFPEGTLFRDNSLHSIFFNLLRLTGLRQGLGESGFHVLLNSLWIGALLVVIGWLVARFFKREKAYAELVKTAAVEQKAFYEQSYRMAGHAMDAVAFPLLAAPVVWEHHFVMAIPIVVWGAAVLGHKKPWEIGICAFLMMGLPAFDVFPFSYHRLVGMVWLLLVLSPTAVRTRFDSEPEGGGFWEIFSESTAPKSPVHGNPELS